MGYIEIESLTWRKLSNANAELQVFDAFASICITKHSVRGKVQY